MRLVLLRRFFFFVSFFVNGGGKDSREWESGRRRKGSLPPAALPASVEQRLVGQAGVDLLAALGAREAPLEAGLLWDACWERWVGALELDIVCFQVLGVNSRDGGEEEGG